MASRVVLVPALFLALLVCVSRAHIQYLVGDIEAVTLSNFVGDIAKAKAAVQNSLKVVKSWPGRKDIINTCVEELGDAIDQLDSTGKALKANRFGDANTYASAALTDANTCLDEFGKSAPPKVTNSVKAAEAAITKVLKDTVKH